MSVSNILIIDDSPEIHALVRVRLKNEPVAIHSAFNGASGVEMAQALGVDLILLDVEMPEQDGFEVCSILKNHAATRDVPIIFLTGSGSTQDKIRGLELGATDYVTKPFDPAELRARVRASLRTRHLMDLLAKRAMIDGLTGLHNRFYLDAQLTLALTAARRSGEPLSCVMADVDYFKRINDECGHQFGDDVLRKIGSILTDVSRDGDIVCRYGGEEFTILMPNTSLRVAIAATERLRRAIETTEFWFHDRRVPVTCSFGVARLGETIPPTVIELADQALYRAKRGGRNQVQMCLLNDPDAEVEVAPEATADLSPL